MALRLAIRAWPGCIVLGGAFACAAPQATEKSAVAQQREEILRRAAPVHQEFVATFVPKHEVNLGFRPQTTSELAGARFVSARQLLSISRSRDLPADEAQRIEMLLRQVTLEFEAGLFRLDDEQRAQLYRFPRETHEYRDRIRTKPTMVDFWSGVGGLGNERTAELLSYLDAHEKAVQRGLPAMDAVDATLPKLEGRLAFQIGYFMVPEQAFCAALGLDGLESVPQKLRPPPGAESEWMAKCRDSFRMASAVQATAVRNELGKMGSDVVAQIESTLFSTGRLSDRTSSVSPYQRRTLDVLVKKLVAALPEEQRRKAAGVAINVSVNPEKPEQGTPAGHVLGLITSPERKIDVSPSLVRAGFAYCSGLASLVAEMHHSLTVPRKPAVSMTETLSLEARLHEESESALKPTPLISLRQPSLLSRSPPGQVWIGDLGGFLQRYETCIEEAFAFPLAHELAHIYLGRVVDTHVALHMDEDACDCAAMRHMQAIGRSRDSAGLFKRTLLKAIEAGNGKYLGEGFNKDNFVLRMKALAERKCTP